MTLTQNQFYCVSSRHKITIPSSDICFKNYKNSRMKDGNVPSLIAYCSKCDCKLTKFIKHKDADKLSKKFGKC